MKKIIAYIIPVAIFPQFVFACGSLRLTFFEMDESFRTAFLVVSFLAAIFCYKLMRKFYKDYKKSKVFYWMALSVFAISIFFFLGIILLSILQGMRSSCTNF
jgi:hypothetical protein